MNVMEHYEQMGYCPNCQYKKALDIIRTKIQLNISIILFSKDYSEYVDFYVFQTENCDRLTKEEYEIIKRGLLQ